MLGSTVTITQNRVGLGRGPYDIDVGLRVIDNVCTMGRGGVKPGTPVTLSAGFLHNTHQTDQFPSGFIGIIVRSRLFDKAGCSIGTFPTPGFFVQIYCSVQI